MRYISRLPLDSPLPWPRRVAIMGSTGSIGVNTLRVLDAMGGAARTISCKEGR